MILNGSKHQLVPAFLWRRALARVIDLIVLGCVLMGALYITTRLRLQPAPAYYVILCGFPFLYEVFVPFFTRGRSVGRAILRIRIVRESGIASTFFRYFARFLARVGLYAIFVVFVAYEFDAEILGFVFLIEGIAILVTPRRTSLADLVARTLVTQAN